MLRNVCYVYLYMSLYKHTTTTKMPSGIGWLTSFLTNASSKITAQSFLSACQSLSFFLFKINLICLRQAHVYTLCTLLPTRSPSFDFDFQHFHFYIEIYLRFVSVCVLALLLSFSFDSISRRLTPRSFTHTRPMSELYNSF